MPQPTSLETRMMRPGKCGRVAIRVVVSSAARAVDCRAGFGLCSRLAGEEQVGQPQRQAIDQNAGFRRRQSAQLIGQLNLFLDAMPVGWAARAVMGDAGRHFAVAGLAGGQVDDLEPGGGRVVFGQQALARARAADDQFFHGGSLGDCRLPGKPDNSPRFDETEPGAEIFSIPGRARRCNRGRLSQDATGNGTNPGREGAASRTIRKPEDVSNRFREPVDRASRSRSMNAAARPFCVF